MRNTLREFSQVNRGSRQGLVQARTLARCSRKSIGDVVNFKSNVIKFKDFSSVKSSFLLFALLFLPKSLTKLHKSVAKPFEYILF